ncbi:hypothetical protein ABLE94_21855 [Gordonia sp. VNK1]|uniref:hypothetical protein n=1 Tax=Gordonia oleivorans TaxID=3156618 RepID=UPI0032B4A9B3
MSAASESITSESVTAISTPVPLVTETLRPVVGVEIRSLDDRSCVISRGEAHHIIGLPAATVTMLIAAWQAGRDELVSADLTRAAHPLRALIGDRSVEGASTVRSVAPQDIRRRGIDALISGDGEAVDAMVTLTHPDDRLIPVEWTGARAVVNQAFTTRSPLVVVVQGSRESDLIDIDRMCHDMRVTWLPVEITRGRLWVGPVVTPGLGASYEDAAARRLAAARDPRVLVSCGHRPSPAITVLVHVRSQRFSTPHWTSSPPHHRQQPAQGPVMSSTNSGSTQPETSTTADTRYSRCRPGAPHTAPIPSTTSSTTEPV